MQVFTYTAKDKNGELQKGEVEAENENSAAKMLSSRNLVPINVFKQEEKSFNLFKHVSLKDKTLIARQLATMINAGLPISQSLRTLEEQLQNPRLRKMLEAISGDVEGGSSLSNAFARFPDFFSALDITLISAGETSGTLDKTLLRLADQLEKEQSLIRKVRGALYYPAFIIIVVIGVVALMVIYVMPQMKDLYASFDADLPFLTRALIASSNFLGKFFPFIFAGLGALGFFLRNAVKKPVGRRIWDKIKIEVWGIGELMKKIYMARFSQTLSTLIGSGVPLLDALQITSKGIGNVLYEEFIMDAAEKVKAGVALSEPLKANPYFPPVVPQMIAVGEKTGELDSMLKNLSDYFEEEVEVLVKGLSNLLEPIIIVVIGGIVALILVGIMMPIYGLGNVL